MENRQKNNWKTYKLGEVADVQNGYAFKSKELVDSGVPVIKIKNIVPPNISLEGAGYFNGEIDNKLKKYLIKRGDFLISMTGSTVNVMSSAVGKMGKYRLDNLALLNQRAGKIYVTKPKKLDFEYLCHFLNRYEVHYNLALNATGSANQANISPAQIKDIDLVVPPLPEQKAVANILSAIDDKIENNLAINKTLEDMAMALYKHWFVDFGPFQDGEFVDSELGMIPKGWVVKSIGDVIETLGGGTPKTSESSYWKNGSILWYSPTDLTRDNAMFSLDSSKKINELGLSKSSAKLFPPYSLLMSSRATIGVLTINTKEASTNQGFITMIPNDKISIYQLYSWTKDNLDLIISKANGSTFKEISKTNFRNLKIVIGKDIELFLRDSKDIFEKVENNIKENQSLTKLRDTLLPKLISGEVRLKEFREQVENIIG